MLSSPILYFGDDHCHRVPVFERLGVKVRRVSCSARGLRSALEASSYSAITFHEDLEPVPDDVLAVAHSFAPPVVLFENPWIAYNPQWFDLIIPSQTPPSVWLQSLQSTISRSRDLHARSNALRNDAAAVRRESRELQERVQRLIPSPINMDEIWRMDWNTGRPAAFPPGYDDPDKKA